MDAVIDQLKSPTFLAKLVELALDSISTALFMTENSSLKMLRAKWAVVFGTLLGFIMVSIIIITSTMLKSPLHRTVMLVTVLSGALLFFATGGIMIETWYHGDNATVYLIGSAISAFLCGVVYLGDFALTTLSFS